MYPTDKDQFVSSKTAKELMILLDEYLCLMIEYLQENANRTKLELLAAQSS